MCVRWHESKQNNKQCSYEAGTCFVHCSVARIYCRQQHLARNLAVFKGFPVSIRNNTGTHIAWPRLVLEEGGTKVAYVYIYIDVCIYVYIYMYIYICMCIYVHIYVHMDAWVHAMFHRRYLIYPTHFAPQDYDPEPQRPVCLGTAPTHKRMLNNDVIFP